MGLLDTILNGAGLANQAMAAKNQGQRDNAIQQSQLLRAIALQNAQIEHMGAQTNEANAKATHTIHEDKAPVLGEAGYNDAKRGESQAVAEGTVEPSITKAVGIAKGEAPIRVKQAVDTAAGVAPITRATDAARITAEGKKDIDVSHQTVGDKVQVAQQTGRVGMAGANMFAKANAPLVNSVPAYANAKNAFAEAHRGNPAALKSAILGFASVADPKANLRQGVINMISQVDPSVRGNFDLALARLGSGTLPPRVLDDMERLVDQTHATNKALYEQRRSGVVARQPGAETYIPTSDEVFNVPGIQNGPPAAPHGGKTYNYNGVTYQVPE